MAFLFATSTAGLRTEAGEGVILDISNLDLEKDYSSDGNTVAFLIGARDYNCSISLKEVHLNNVTMSLGPDSDSLDSCGIIISTYNAQIYNDISNGLPGSPFTSYYEWYGSVADMPRYNTIISSNPSDAAMFDTGTYDGNKTNFRDGYTTSSSTNVQKTEKYWTDGKPIYRRVVNLWDLSANYSSDNTWHTASLWLDSPDTLVGAKVLFNGRDMMYSLYSSSAIQMRYYVDKMGFDYTMTSWYAVYFTNTVVIVEYTKTTD